MKQADIASKFRNLIIANMTTMNERDATDAAFAQMKMQGFVLTVFGGRMTCEEADRQSKEWLAILDAI